MQELFPFLTMVEGLPTKQGNQGCGCVHPGQKVMPPGKCSRRVAFFSDIIACHSKPGKPEWLSLFPRF